MVDSNSEDNKTLDLGNLDDNQDTDTNDLLLIAKHCPNPDCFLYMKPQPGRTWCAECDTELVY